ncbi:MAG TPA: hypothetical protein PLU87_00310 [Sedimentisphaerales bacterium]|nr:hypothetical protein [Sedimentisphaerales bacterium]HRS09683.1 hypothetical protein [Sedimentisphaerales bacterium]HRV46364.1 hypothetical protein [Sedimentisphaerales bacterium]
MDRVRRCLIWILFGCGIVAASPVPGDVGYAGRQGVTLYVSEVGDNSDGLIWARAFRTIQAALNAVPDDGGGHRVIVRPDHYMEPNLETPHKGAPGAYNLLIGDVDGRLGSGAQGWVVIDAGLFWDLTHESGAGFTVLVEDCRMIVLNFSQPMISPSTGIICSERNPQLLHVDLKDCILAGYQVFGTGGHDEKISYKTEGRVQAYLQFEQTAPAGFERLGAWPIELFFRIAPPQVRNGVIDWPAWR